MAAAKASRHQARSKKLGLSKHFTAWEWLDLCAAFEFKCYICRSAGPLEPHHCTELFMGGSNSIDNIRPICRDCHICIHEGNADISETWIAEQRELSSQFHEGDIVRRRWNPRSLPGVIVELVPLQPGMGPLRAWICRDGPIVAFNKFARSWVEAKARVRWPRGSSAYHTSVSLKDLVRKD